MRDIALNKRPWLLNAEEIKIVVGIRHGVEARGKDWVYPQDRTDERWWYIHEPFRPRCRNIQPNGDPACIMGYALIDAGYSPPPTESIRRALQLLRIEATPWFQSVLAFAQEAQDSGQPWGQVERVLLKTLNPLHRLQIWWAMR